MKYYVALLILSLFSGLISCNSDKKETPEVIITHGDFKINPPQVYRIDSSQRMGLKEANQNSTTYSIYDKLEFDTKGVEQLFLNSSCSQNNTSHQDQRTLPLSNSFNLYELLPTEIVKKFSNSEIRCDLKIEITDIIERKTIHRLKNILLTPYNWHKTQELIDSTTQKPITNDQFFHLESIESLKLSNSNFFMARDKFALFCENTQEIFSHNYNLDVFGFNWNHWYQQKNNDSKQWVLRKCKFISYANHRIIAWTHNFYVYNNNSLIEVSEAKTNLKNRKKAFLKYTVRNKSRKNLILRFKRRNINSALYTVDAFNVFKSAHLPISGYHPDLDESNFWASAKINKITYKFNSGRILKNDDKYVYYKLPAKSKKILKFFVKRKKACRKIHSEYSIIKQKHPIQFDILVSQYSKAKMVPYDSLLVKDFEKLKLKKSAFNNRSNSDLFTFSYADKARAPMHTFTGQIEKITSERLRMALRNKIKNFNCRPTSLNEYLDRP